MATFTIVLSNPGQEDAWDIEMENFLPLPTQILWNLDSADVLFGRTIYDEGPPPDPSTIQVLRCDPGRVPAGAVLTAVVSGTTPDACVTVPNPPKAGFDTYVGEGIGACNGLPATIRFVFTDAGEPGTKDSAEYHISGACTLDAGPGNLDKGGNQQAHKG